MAKRGRKRTPVAILRQRGSIQPRLRKKKLQSNPLNMVGKKLPHQKRDWTNLLRLIPGYDSRRDGKGFVFDEARAEKACRFFEDELQLIEGETAGQPFELISWQQAALGAIFGWVDEKGRRRYREVWLYLPRKSGKTPFVAGLLDYVLLYDGEPGAQIYCLDPETPVLTLDLRWVSVKSVRVGDNLLGFDEYPKQKGAFRKLRSAAVDSVGRVSKMCRRLTFEDGREVVCSNDHQLLAKPYLHSDLKMWVRADDLKVGSSVRNLGQPWEAVENWDSGYLAGIFDGEGCLTCHPGKRSGVRVSFAQRPGGVLDTTIAMLAEKGFFTGAVRRNNKGNDCCVFDIAGSTYETIRFLGLIRPHRLLDKATTALDGIAPNKTGGHLKITKIEELGKRECVAVGTSTRTLFANGLFSHNCAAADKAQAGIAFRHAGGMIEHNPKLAAMVQIFKSNKTITFLDSFARVISADVANKHGFNSHLVVVDEVHALPNRDLIDVLTTSTSSRRQPLVIYITTADYNRPSICNERYDYACKVRDGLVNDPRFLPIIYEAGPEDDWESEATWFKANPSLGITKKLEYMQRECEKAKNEPTYQATFRRLELNQRTDSDQVWLASADWDACDRAATDDELDGKPCWGGLDLSSTGDMTAFVLCWPLPNDEVAIRAWHWIPEDTARLKEKRDRVPYLAWRTMGLVEMTPGNVIDYGFIRKKIVDLCRRWKVRDVGFDPWNATQITTELSEQDGVKLFEFRQGFVSMSAPAKDFERRVRSHKLAHGGSKILRWQASHAVIRSDPAGNIKPDKEKATQRIDGIVAAVMALGRANVEGGKGGSVYEGRGIRSLGDDPDPAKMVKEEDVAEVQPSIPPKRERLTNWQESFDRGD